MKRKWMHKWLAVLVCSTLATACFSQNGFAYRATLDEVKKDGFYRIILTPAIVAKSGRYLSDVRIFDNKQNQMPYITKIDSAQFLETSFVEFPIISNKKGKDKQTHITIENKTGKAINDLLLVVANMEAYRSINISGSNDLMDWYIIKENAVMDSYFSGKKETSVQSISLPTVSYQYFQVTILGENVLPFNIIKAGIYNEQYASAKYMEVPPPKIIPQNSTDKKTHFQLKFDEPYTIDKIVLSIDGPRFYSRQLYMETCGHPSTLPYSATINSGDATLLFSLLKNQEACFFIDNKDNAPLTIKSAKAYQLNKYMLAYLEKGKQYHLAFGDPLAKAPEYDLAFFKDSIGATVPILTVGQIEPIKPVQQTIAGKPQNNNRVFLWITIATISILLLVFTLKMTREIKKRNNHADL